MVSVAISCFESAMCSSSIELRLEERSRFRIITECAQRMPLFNKSSTLEFVNHQSKIGKICSEQFNAPIPRSSASSGGSPFHMLLVVVFVGLGKGRLIKDVSLALYKSTPARWHLAPGRSFWLNAIQARARWPPPQPRQLFKVNCRIGSTARANALIYTNGRQ